MFKILRYLHHLNKFCRTNYHLNNFGYRVSYSPREKCLFVHSSIYDIKFNLVTNILAISDAPDFDGCGITTTNLFKFNPKTKEFEDFC